MVNAQGFRGCPSEANYTKPLNARANPRVTVLFDVESEQDDRRVLRIRGRATVRADSGLRWWYLRHDMWKYFVNWRGFRNAITHARLLFVVRHYLSSGVAGSDVRARGPTGDNRSADRARTNPKSGGVLGPDSEPSSRPPRVNG
uniref:pyridoxamine 5'-phosphate oxidase family protein n=1 Tax=Nocardia niigatensis TaxID=209249 RepID=UPI0012F64668